jgi:hypothetical protein
LPFFAYNDFLPPQKDQRIVAKMFSSLASRPDSAEIPFPQDHYSFGIAPSSLAQ